MNIPIGILHMACMSIKYGTFPNANNIKVHMEINI